MKREEIWRTIDGKTFDSEVEARVHEEKVVIEDLATYSQKIEYISHIIDDFIEAIEIDIADGWSSRYDTKYFTDIVALMNFICRACPIGGVEEVFNDVSYFRLNGKHKELIDE